MKLQKVDVVYVPISTDVEMPPRGKKISVSFDNGENFSWETIGKDWSKEEVNYTHWLKPLPDRYLLTEDELESIKFQEYNRGYEAGNSETKIPF